MISNPIETSYQGAPLYYLADGMGACWLGGWRDRATAEARLAQCEATDWDADQVDTSVDVPLDETGRVPGGAAAIRLRCSKRRPTGTPSAATSANTGASTMTAMNGAKDKGR